MSDPSDSKTNPSKGRTKWHKILGDLLKLDLTPLQVEVYTDYPVMDEPPEADIVIIRRKTEDWTEEQRDHIPDGLLQYGKRHNLIEFKYTESVSEAALLQILAYGFFYQRSKNLKKNQMALFLMSSKTPHRRFRESYGFQETEIPGVLRSTLPLLESIKLIVLNDLDTESRNLLVKLFSSRPKEKIRVIDTIVSSPITETAKILMKGFSALFNLGEKKMKELTLEDIYQLGVEFDAHLQKILSVEDRLRGLSLEDRLRGLRPEDRLRGLRAEDRLRGLRAEDRLRGLRAEDRLKGLAPEDRLKGLKPEERLRGMSKEEIKAYLDSLEGE